jgi:ABC-type cobalamin/Fe3+-siderophores transport system ATPase subunit
MNERPTLILIDGITASYNGTAVLSNYSLSIMINQRWAIIGRNGTGKSTLIKIIIGLFEQKRGSVYVNGKDIRKYGAQERARMIAYVPQKPEGVIPYTVHDYVLLGRYAAMGLFALPSETDRKAVLEAIDICDVKHLYERLMSTLSGGELQRVILAGAVAQQTPILLLDEPTTFLDPAHERLFFRALSRVQQERDLTVVMVTHDINTALSTCTHVCALQSGAAAYSGPVELFAAQCPGLLTNIFGVPFERFECESKKLQVFGGWGIS